MTKIENPSRVSIIEANKQFSPYSYVMINCEIIKGAVIAGEVVAYAPLEQKGTLVDYGWEMSVNGCFGEVTIEDTIDLLDGGTVWIEHHSVSHN